MAKPYSDIESEDWGVFVAIMEGRMEDAKKIAAELLRRRDDQLSDCAAYLLTLKKRPGKRGPEPDTVPKHWKDIGKCFDLMQPEDLGFSYDEKIDALAYEFGCSRRTVESTLAFYKNLQQSRQRVAKTGHLSPMAQRLERLIVEITDHRKS